MPKVKKVCAACGKQFEVWPNRAETAKYCSPACRDTTNAKRYEEARPKLACVICGKEYGRPACHEKRSSCCSLECAHELSRRRVVPRGAAHYSWKGGASLHCDGYRYLLVESHPFAKDGRYIFEHRLVVEEWMRAEAPDHPFMVEVDGVKYLSPDIEVHHLNEDKRDNRPANLLACTQPAHRAIHNGQPPMEGQVWPPVKGMVPFEPYRVKCTCLQCGGEFQVKRSTFKRGGGKYCCRACYNARPREAFHVVPLT